jgi:uncharacterized protein with von Willebrand factor type A (vWA) domain
MIKNVIVLANLLRSGGAPVSTPEVMDSLAALAALPSYDLPAVRTVLKCCLIKDKELQGLFERAFAGAFKPSPAQPEEGGGIGSAGAPGEGGTRGDGTGGASGAGNDVTRPGGEGKVTPEYLAAGSGLLNVPFLSARPGVKQQMLAVVREVAKKMASQKDVRTKRGGKRPDFRRLWRNSLGAGGVPLELAWRERRENKPRVFIICDLSNSMYAYLPFFLEFVFSFAAMRGTVRVFGFIDVLEEITSLIDPLNVEKSVEMLSARARVLRRGLTDYGNAFKGFYRKHREELTRRTYIVVVGDARNNYFNAGTDYLREFRARAGGIYWLNPEDEKSWGTGDSYMDVYAQFCDGAIACENISELKKFAGSLSLG